MGPQVKLLHDREHPKILTLEHDKVFGYKLLSQIVRGKSMATEQAAGGYELRILRSLRRIIRAVEMYSKKLASSHKITGPQLVCLLSIMEKEPLTATQIARDVHLSASTVVGVLDRLEEKGLTQRERDKSDRRKVYVTLTDKGRELADSAPSPLQDKLSLALNALNELEQVSIALALEKVVELMEVGDVDASPLLEPGTKIQ